MSVKLETEMEIDQIDSNRRYGVDLDQYFPAYFSWIANKLSRGASQNYLKIFGVGIEGWRCMVLLAAEKPISAQHVSRIIGMDKGTVSRCFKSMQIEGLIEIASDGTDARIRLATLTRKGRAMHDEILGLALERERAFLSVLDVNERRVLLQLLRRLHENLPLVEAATSRYVFEHFPNAGVSHDRTDDDQLDTQ